MANKFIKILIASGYPGIRWGSELYIMGDTTITFNN